MAVYTTITSNAQYYSGSIGGCVGGGEDYRTVENASGIYVYLAFNPQTAGLSKRCILTHIEITGNYRVTNTSNGAGLTLKGSLSVKPIQVLGPTLSGTELLNLNTCSLGSEKKLINTTAGSTSYKPFSYSSDVTINYYVAPNDFVGGRFYLISENSISTCRIWLKDVQFKVTRKRACDITFVTGVDGVADQTTLYDYGDIPSYSGSLSKPNYTFKGWKAPNGTVYTGTLPAAGEVDVTYTAVWELNTYTVKFVNGNTVLQETQVSHGSTPSYTGSTPTKSSTAEYIYTFSGWSPSLSAITANTTYTAQFTSTKRKYTLTISADTGGSVSGGGTYDYGSSVTLKAIANAGYEFVQWSDGNTSPSRNVTVTGDATYTAQFRINRILADQLRAKKLLIDLDTVKAILVDTTKVYGQCFDWRIF